MTRYFRLTCAALALLVGLASRASAQLPAPRVATFDRCPLEGGGAIEECRVAYRTYGRLSPARDNAVVFTTWFLGRTGDLLGFYIGGPDRLVDTTRYYVVAIDAFGDGQSASPSTSSRQHGASFPHFTMRDLVAVQHRLLTETLALSHVHAVMGASMGGMQAVQWSVQYPGYMSRIVAIVPTPRTAAYDRVLWGTELRAIETGMRSGMPNDSLLAVLEGIQALALNTPAYVNRTAPDSADALIQRSVASLKSRFDPWDWASQLRAMLGHDVSHGVAGSLEEAANRVRARSLLVVAAQDHMVTPATIRDWARWTRAEVLELAGDCGHLATGCEQKLVRPAVVEFLSR